MSEIADKVRSLGYLKHKGQTRTKVIVDERNGRTAGKHIEHWDDRQDAVAMPEPAKVKLKVTGQED